MRARTSSRALRSRARELLPARRAKLGRAPLPRRFAPRNDRPTVLCYVALPYIVAQPTPGSPTVSDSFLSSDDYGERAHQLYNEGRYDEAIEVLRDGLEVYPFAVELHVGLAYARLARDEFLWARNSFEEALALDPDHEDALAGLGEVLLKFGHQERALQCFERVLALGFREDHDLILQ